ncbi:MAG: DUF4440 domain-containing protein [Hyphomonas sp.]
MTDEDAVGAVLRELERAHDRKDAKALEACFAPDALIYNLAPPLAKRGRDPEGLDAWFATWDGPITLDAAETEISVRDDLAVAAALNRMRGHQDGRRMR